MRLAADHVRVRVPATSANLGPGFDSLGMALERFDEIEVRAVAGNEIRVQVTGEGAGRLPSGADHLVVSSLIKALEHVGAPLSGFDVICHNTIPHGRGLGSSAAAAVAGIVAARTMIAEPDALDHSVALALATQIEGHPDNAAPAIWGGATIAWMRAGEPHAARFLVKFGLRPIVLLPARVVPTTQARAVLPSHVPHADGAHAASHAALLVHALADDLSLLWEATEDRLHQAYRAEVMPETIALVDALREGGLAAVVSGAGPSVLVLSSDDRVEDDVAACGRILGSLMDPATSPWRMLRPAFAREGASGERL